MSSSGSSSGPSKNGPQQPQEEETQKFWDGIPLTNIPCHSCRSTYMPPPPPTCNIPCPPNDSKTTTNMMPMVETYEIAREKEVEDDSYEHNNDYEDGEDGENGHDGEYINDGEDDDYEDEEYEDVEYEINFGESDSDTDNADSVRDRQRG